MFPKDAHSLLSSLPINMAPDAGSGAVAGKAEAPPSRKPRGRLLDLHGASAADGKDDDDSAGTGRGKGGTGASRTSEFRPEVLHSSRPSLMVRAFNEAGGSSWDPNADRYVLFALNCLPSTVCPQPNRLLLGS